jgi:Tripartite tricarboxylate transporter TctB family
MTDAPRDRGQGGGGGLKSPLDFGGGLFLLALAAVGFAGAFSLPVGHLSGIGSGLMPKTVAVLVAAFGAMLVIQGLFVAGDRLEQWAVRGPIFVLGGVLVFAFTIRSWGLLIAGPLAFVVSALADRDTKPVEVAVMAIGMTLVCGLLFKEMLNLPIPFDPAGLVPDPVFRAYVDAKGALGSAFSAVKAMFSR